MINDNKLKINFAIFLYVFYMLFIVINDYIVYISKIDANIYTYIISLILMLFLVILIHKKIKIDFNFNRVDIVFFLILIFILTLRTAIPDTSFDTLNYHLYLQKNVFKNNTTFNFFPARWINTFSLPLGDRMHYFFRYIFGYRLGIAINPICLIVMYYQTKRIFANLINKPNLVAIFSIIAIITEQILGNMITYYTDLLVIPILLEIIIVILSTSKNNLNNYWVLLLGGLAISLKISNLLLIIPLAIIYLIKYWDTINYKTFLIGIPLFVFPFFIYLLNNYLATGNPVFPFYNKIFKSPYLPNTNWIESFYGPKTIVERLIWPIYTYTSTRRSYDTDFYFGRIAFGFITAIILIVIAIIKRIKNHEKFDYVSNLTLITLIISFMWSNFIMGYIRYALVLEVLGGVLSIYFVYKYFNHKGLNLLCVFVLFTLLYVNYFTIANLLNDSIELSWRYSYIKDKNTFKENIKDIFLNKDDLSNFLDGVSCIGITDYNSGYAAYFNEDIPVIDLHEGFNNDYGKKEFLKVIHKCKNIYTISTTATLDRTKQYIEELGYLEVGNDFRQTKVSFLNNLYDLVIFDVELNETKL